MFILAKSTLWEKNIFPIPWIETAPKIGIDNKKEIFVASSRLNPRNLAAVIPIPDLLTPGISEKIWKIPIVIADLNLKSFFRLFVNLHLSLM